MNFTKKIAIIGYTIRYVDMREPRPRTIYEEVYTLERDGVYALTLMGLNVTDYIKARYERGGYHVISVERITAKRTAEIDLCQLWQAAAPEAEGNEVAHQ